MLERRRAGQTGRLVCTRCNTQYSLSERVWRCSCGGFLAAIYAPIFDKRQIGRRGRSLWRYRDAMPLAAGAEGVSLGEGLTPLLQGRVGTVNVYLKQDHLFPSGSFKDRGAAVMVTQAATIGVTRVVEDSSGNAGAAVAAYCARAGIACEVYVPEETTPAKLVQMRAYGATVHAVSGGRAGAAAAALEAAETIYYASHVWNPFFLHGTKTFAFEVWEQLGWRAPDTVVLPVGNGSLLLGAALGFDELLAAKQISRMPRLIGVQAEACAPLASAFAAGQSAPASAPLQRTLAEGIAIAEPARGAQVLAAVQRTGGQIISVSEDEIVQAMGTWWQLGFAMEPTAAATLAGLQRYVTQGVGAREVIVSTITGHGLKAMDTVASLLG